MKISKILSAIAATAVAASALAANTFAYTLEKDLKTNWSVNTTIPAEEFENATTDSVFKITFTSDDSLVDKNGENYWSIKTMINDSGWPFINDLELNGELTPGGDAYQFDVSASEFKFKVTNAEELEHLQAAGMALMGHGVTLHEFTWSDDDSFEVGSAAPKPVEDVSAAEDTQTVTTTATASNGNPATGVEDIVGGTLLMLAAGGVMALTGKRK